MEALCIFKQINMLRVAAADVTGALPLMRVSDHLSGIAETVLTAVIDLSWKHLTEKHGLPACSLDKTVCERGFAVIAYGKLGGIELGYDSDLDLVFLHAGTPEKTKGAKSTIDSAQFFARLGQRVIHILTTHTPAGFLYETDMRLRPSGSAGLLVCQIDAFREYQLEKAWKWEHQALVRARVVSGDIGLGNYFKQIRKEVLARPRVKSELQEEVGRMRARLRKENLSPGGQFFDLKQSPGGIVDIEFLVQYLVLLKSYEFVELVAWTDNVRLLDTLAKTGVLDAQTADFLQGAYLTYRSAAHRLSLQNKPAMVFENKFDAMRKKTIEIWQRFILKILYGYQPQHL